MEQSQKFEKAGDIFRNFFTNNTLFYRQFLLFRIRENWSEIMGKLSEHCYPIGVQEGRLNIGVDSAPLANQMYMMQGTLLGKINNFLKGEKFLNKLNFTACSSLEKFRVSDEIIKE